MKCFFPQTEGFLLMQSIAVDIMLIVIIITISTVIFFRTLLQFFYSLILFFFSDCNILSLSWDALSQFVSFRFHKKN